MPRTTFIVANYTTCGHVWPHVHCPCAVDAAEAGSSERCILDTLMLHMSVHLLACLALSVLMRSLAWRRRQVRDQISPRLRVVRGQTLLL